MDEINDFEALVNTCASFYQKNRDSFRKEKIRKRRQQLGSSIEKYHINSGTYSRKVKLKIDALKDDASIILMTAHQPNLFPYSGVLRKSTLLFALQNELEKRLDAKVACFYGIADQDFADDRWVKSTVIPSITRKGGALTLNANLPEKVILNKVPKPSRDTIEKWRGSVKTWINDSTSSIGKFYSKSGLSNWEKNAQCFTDSFETFWEIVEEAYKASTNYSDFNAFTMSKIVNDAWEYDTLFARFSECQRIYEEEFNYLLTNFTDYSTSLKEAIDESPSNQERGVAQLESENIPFWYHCDCGGKVKLKYKTENNTIFGHGVCSNCQKEFNINLGESDHPDISKISHQISARAIPMILIFSKGLGLTCYIGGVGGRDYLREAQHVAERLHIKMPIIGYWRPKDFYLSLSNMEALLEYNRISGDYEIHKWKEEIKSLNSRIEDVNEMVKNLELKKNYFRERKNKKDISENTFIEEMRKISEEITKIRKESDVSVLQSMIKELSNIPFVMSNIPSIIDYTVNIGLKDISDQWIGHLINKGSLSSDVNLKSYLYNIINFDNYIYEEVYDLWKNLKE
jgi:hypothetical protein